MKRKGSGYFRKQENYHLWEAEIQPLNQLIGVNKQALKALKIRSAPK